MFKVDTVTTCPVVKELKGKIFITPEVIAAISGAVWGERDDEWAIYLLGDTSDNGLRIKVDGFRVPPQTRTGSMVEIPMEELPDHLVGVLHSHHKMGAFFSEQDQTDFNEKYPISIVVSSRLKSSNQRESEMWTSLGFSYKATGLVRLKCGQLGRVDMEIEPLGIENWPWASEEISEETVIGTLATKKIASLGDCGQSSDDSGSPFLVQLSGKCGLGESEAKPKVQGFGFKEGAEIMKELPKPKSNEIKKEEEDWRVNLLPLSTKEKEMEEDTPWWAGDIEKDFGKIGSYKDARNYVKEFPEETAEIVLGYCMERQDYKSIPVKKQNEKPKSKIRKLLVL